MDELLPHILEWTGEPGLLVVLGWLIREQVRLNRLVTDLSIRLVSVELKVHKKPLPTGEHAT